MTRSGRVKEIRYLGTSWSDRGVAYWRRRIGYTMIYLAMFALSSIVALLATWGLARGEPFVAQAIIVAVAVSGCSWSFYAGFRLMRRSDEEKALGVPMIMRSGSTPESRERAGWAGVGAGIVAGPLVVIAQIFVVGFMAAAVVSSVQRYITIEEFEAATGKKAPRHHSPKRLLNRTTRAAPGRRA